uniref:Palmitoyltransferase n=1 Tax=Strigamia maritima TaxID=126957 RepID=T1J7N8_STRMM
MCVGPLKRLWHWGPLLALGIVKVVSLSMWHCSLMWWSPFNSLGGFLNMSIFTMWNALTLYHFFSAMIIGPGSLPANWKPENRDEIKYLQYCKFCDGYKAPRAHHCRKCNKCIKKMDHHCPWINNCCGHDNHTHFVLFLLCAVCGCMQASIVLCCSLYRALHRKWYMYYGTGDEPVVILGLFGFICCTFALGMALGVVIAVGGLFYFQKEQIRQKDKKRCRAKKYIIVEGCSGNWFPISKGFRVCCSVPLSDESRIRLDEGDRVLVTRWKRHWLYGEKILTELQYATQEVIRIRGWFPRVCAVEITNIEGVQSTEKIKKA